MLFVYAMRKLIGLLILLFLLSGCFESSLVVGPIIGGAQGKIAQSSISTGFSYGIKHKTGKYPIQHIFKQKKEKKEKKEKTVKTTSLMEEKVLTTTNKIKHNPVKKAEVKLVKANYKTAKAKITKLKIQTISKKTFVHEPRFSYLAR